MSGKKPTLHTPPLRFKMNYTNIVSTGFKTLNTDKVLREDHHQDGVAASGGPEVNSSVAPCGTYARDAEDVPTDNRGVLFSPTVHTHTSC